MILAGDIGGTNARLAFFEADGGQLRQISESVYPSHGASGLDEIVVRFVREQNRRPTAASFGIAGPVVNGQVRASNLPWTVEASSLARELGLSQVLLINDLEANGWGIGALTEHDLVPLCSAKAATNANQAVISAGTGLGEAGIYWDGRQHHVFACEGGHSDFAPRNELEIELLKYLIVKFGHVSTERVLSGPGLVNVFHFLCDTGRGHPASALLQELANSDPAAVISRAAMQGQCPVSAQALDLFVSIYGAEAGNLALKIMAIGGVFIGGGIAPKILPKLQGPLFMEAFLAKGRMSQLLAKVPVSVITNDKTALLGAARCALVKLLTQ